MREVPIEESQSAPFTSRKTSAGNRHGGDFNARSKVSTTGSSTAHTERFLLEWPHIMATTFFIETHGCQMNEHDSERISGVLAHRGMVPVSTLEEADLYILNTCNVRE